MRPNRLFSQELRRSGRATRLALTGEEGLPYTQIMRKGSITLVGLWVAVVAPSLCASGVLAHPCVCLGVRGCHHESGCADDPCDTVMVANRLNGARVHPAPSAPTTAICSVAPRLSDALDRPPGPDGFNRSIRLQLPLHPTDIPLLI